MFCARQHFWRLVNLYIRRDIPETTLLIDAASVGADEAHDADIVLAAAYLRNCAF
jgi:hypothetical protein